jgi:hypothetical protein
MKLYFFFAMIDLIILLIYPIAYIANLVQKLTGAKPRRKNELDRTY